MSDFKDVLQDLLSERSLNCFKLSKLINIPMSTLNGYLNTKYYPSLENAIRLAKFFDCSINYLLGLADDKLVDKKYNNNSFIDNFDTLRKANAVSISKALREMKMSEYNYYRWKAGQFPKTNNLIEISKHFNTSIDYLIGKAYYEL